jgi:hypothetical protein
VLGYIRETPQLTMVASKRKAEDLLLCISQNKKIFQKCDVQPKRRIKVCMMQVIGSVFTGLSDEPTELDIINVLVKESQRCAYDPMGRKPMMTKDWNNHQGGLSETSSTIRR